MQCHTISQLCDHSGINIAIFLLPSSHPFFLFPIANPFLHPSHPPLSSFAHHNIGWQGFHEEGRKEGQCFWKFQPQPPTFRVQSLPSPSIRLKLCFFLRSTFHSSPSPSLFPTVHVSFSPLFPSYLFMGHRPNSQTMIRGDRKKPTCSAKISLTGKLLLSLNPSLVSIFP